MSSLSPESRDLIDAARDGDALGDEDRRRMRGAILAQVGVTTAAVATAATTATATATAATAAKTATVAKASAAGVGALSLIKLGLGAAFVTALGLGAISMATSSPDPAPPAPVDAPTPPPALDPQPSGADADGDTISPDPQPPAAADAEEAEAIVNHPPVAPPKATPPRDDRRDRTLADETALLQRAQAQIKVGNNEAALELLAEHQGSFADGAMVEEREAARVLALCGSGRVAEGRVAAQSFAARFPRSPHKGRVLGACPAP